MKLKVLIAFFILCSLFSFSQVDLGADIESCEGNTVVLDATTPGAITYEWYRNGFIITGEVSSTLSVYYTDIYEVYVQVEGDTFTDDIVVTFNPNPIAQTLTDFSLCDNNLDGFGTFDLTSKDFEIIGNQTEVYVSYFDSQVSAEQYINPIVGPYVNSANPQTIWARIENTVTGCFTVVDFDLILDPNCEDLEVLCGPVPLNIEYCYPNNSVKQYNFFNPIGSPLTVVFNSGQLELNIDKVIVIDSDGATQLFNGDNNGDLEGLTIQSIGSSISVRIESNDSISCADGSSELIDFDVFCADFAGSISGRAFFDENNNDIFDGNDANFRNGYYTYEVNNSGIINEIVSTDGNYYIANAEEGNSYEITYNLYEGYQDCYTITTNAVSNITVTGNEALEINFPVTNDLMCEDLGVYLLSPFAQQPRPGFHYINRVYIENFGFSTINSGTIEFVADDLVEFVETSYQTNPNHVVTYTSNGFTLDFTNLQPGDIEYINVRLYCPASVELGQVVNNTVTYTMSGNDDFELNNTSELAQIVVGSWDPNDKMESHGPEIVYDDFSSSDEFLYYTIRFQNLGTADAITVRIEDALDASLNEDTFQMLRSSHNYSLSKIDNEITWQFDNIYLPAEQDDEEGSQGFVYFKIKPKSGYAIGDIIPNTASIFFDFNAPVITNLFDSEFVEDALSVEDSNFIFFDMFPNPANDLVTIRLSANNSGNVTVNIIDLQGKLILEQHISEGNTMELDITDLQSGLYFVKLNANNKSLVKKLIIE